MALNEAAVLDQVRTIAAGVTGVVAAYSAAALGDNGLPESLNDEVTALVFPGDTLEYLLSAAHHRHTYQVKVQLACTGGNVQERTAKAVPFRTRLIEAFTKWAGGAEWDSAVLVPPVQFVTSEYGGTPWAGWELTLRVSEQAITTAGYDGG